MEKPPYLYWVRNNLMKTERGAPGIQMPVFVTIHEAAGEEAGAPWEAMSLANRETHGRIPWPLCPVQALSCSKQGPPPPL